MNTPTFYDLASFDALYDSAKECLKNVSWKRSVQEFKFHMLSTVADLSKLLAINKYKSKGFVRFWIWERGKRRFIQSVHITERVVQKSLCNNALKQIVEPLLINENCASRKGYGTKTALDNMERHLAQHYDRYGLEGGILVIDLHDYFHSIDHDILIHKYREIIADEQILNLLIYFIKCFDEGLGLGSEISQISAIFYANDIDHYIQDTLGINGYGRYMDDSYIIYHDLEKLKNIKNQICNMYHNLHIELNPDKTQIIPFKKSDFAFLKKRFHMNADGSIVIRPIKNRIKRTRRKLKKLKRKLGDQQISMVQIRQTYRSIRGELTRFNCMRDVYELDKLYLRLFNENYDGATIEDIAFRKNLYEMYRNGVSRSDVKSVFLKWLDGAEWFCYKKCVVRNMKQLIYKLYNVRWSDL